MAQSLTRRERGVVVSQGYVFIRFWPQGRKNKPFREHFGPATDDNIKLANFKMREYRNKVALNKFDVERPAVPMLFKDAWPIFLDKHKKSLKPYTSALVPFFGTYCLHDITPQHVKDWRTAREKEVTFATVNKNQAILSSVFERFREWNAVGGIFADKVKLPAENPCKYITKPTERHRKRERVLTPEEWDRLSPALAAQAVDHKGLILEAGWLLDHAKMALHSTFSLSDISKLAGMTITGEVMKGIRSKTGIGSSLPFTESLRAIALRIAARPRVNPGVVQKYFRAACSAANVKDFTFRDLRRTSVSWLDKLGVSPTVQRDRAAHADTKTTDGYRATNYSEHIAGIRKLEDTFK